MLSSGMRKESPALAAAACAGGACAVGQVLLIREALTLWSGFELAAGLVLASWLLFAGLGGAVGARMVGTTRRARAALAWGLPAMALALPAGMLAMRAAPEVAGLGPGELPGLTILLATAMLAPAPSAGAAGLLFAAAWAATGSAAQAKPLRIYMLEALGATAGGLALAFVLLPNLGSLRSCLAASVVLLGPAAWCALCLDRGRGRAVGACLAAALLLAAGLAGSAGLDRASRAWQWGKRLVEVRDTPYQNLALLENHGQLSLFANGLWSFSLPDEKSAQQDAHLPLLMHADPRSVLVLEGDPFGLPQEVLAHPGVDRVDVVLQDPGVLGIVPARPPQDPRLELRLRDPAAYVREAGRRYDVVILAAGDPLSMGSNRLYSLEFFRDMKKRLAEGGVLGLSVSGPALSPGPAQLARLRSILATL
ncbi:MAG: spermidine synthase, partial [Desulfovibrionaceae bacterium]